MVGPDINEISNGSVISVDDNFDPVAFFRPALLDDGWHLGVLKLGDRGIKVERQKDSSGDRTGPEYVMAHIQVRSVDESGKEGPSAFDTATSIRLAGGSRLHAILALAGDPAPKETTPEDLKAHCESFFAQPQQIAFKSQWEAQVNDGSKERPKYRTIARGQRKFPKLVDQATGEPTGKYDPEIQDPKNPETVVRAQVNVVEYNYPSALK
jgi:hypothetical protein